MRRSKLHSIEDWMEVARVAKYRSAALAAICGVSSKTVERFFRLKMDATPQQWLSQMRKLEAERLVSSGSTTKAIAGELGYQHTSNFCRAFKREHGFAATALRRTSLNQDSAGSSS